MVCYHPIKGFRSKTVNPSGKRGIVFNANAGYVDLPVTVPCGQCVGCRLERSRQWAVRCVHEASRHEDNCFLTLTYSDEHMPEGQTLVKKHFQDFMKRARKRLDIPLRYFHCGEYGERYGRPHYHACLFGYRFPDRYVWKKTGSDQVIYRSPLLEELWPHGYATLGELTFQSAAYCARYILKKYTGPEAAVYQPHSDPTTGEVFAERQPPYVTMSLRPGIGFDWLQEFTGDVYPCDFVVIDGKRFRSPRYYDRVYEAMEGDLLELKRARRVQARLHADNNTPDRLKVREVVQNAKLQLLKREVDDNGKV